MKTTALLFKINYYLTIVFSVIYFELKVKIKKPPKCKLEFTKGKCKPIPNRNSLFVFYSLPNSNLSFKKKNVNGTILFVY